MKTYLLAFLFLIAGLYASAHEDTKIFLTKEGKLVGFPKKYDNAEFDSTTFTLRINDKQIVVPECVSVYFRKYQNYTLNFSASWYHEQYVIPYYLCMEIVFGEHKKGFQILFNLETLEIFQISDIEYNFHNSEPLPQTHDIPISRECHREILNSISELK